ncbi:TPA: hypothetical protein ACH3X1_008856 [Trebouxia sp. C0004]
MPELIQKAEHLLHKAHSVFVSGSPAAHGDARLDNILVLVEAGHVKQLRLVNFDWAGVAGSTQYPVLLNAKTIVWPEGVGPGDPLQQKHDIELLQYQVNPATRAAVNNGGKCLPTVCRSVTWRWTPRSLTVSVAIINDQRLLYCVCHACTNYS